MKKVQMEQKKHLKILLMQILLLLIGFKVAGDKTATGSESKTQYLGSTVNINSGDITDNSTTYKLKT